MLTLRFSCSLQAGNAGGNSSELELLEIMEVSVDVLDALVVHGAARGGSYEVSWNLVYPACHVVAWSFPCRFTF